MIWKSRFYDKRYIEEKMKILQRDSFMTNLLLNRGIYTKEDADKFLNPNFKQLHNPYLFENMEEVVNLLLKYRNSERKILIFGDYDIDGMSGSVYLSKIFDYLSIKNYIYIPSRTIFKYNLEDEFYDNLLKNEIDLIITVDNSFGDDKEIQKLKNIGVRLIITDHHKNNKYHSEILEINPKKSLKYPFKELSGSGVVFKLVQGLYSKINDREIHEIYDYCELISLATIADVMECTDENRFLIKRGLKNFSRSKILAINIILENLKINPQYININDISYRISPLLNAIGKLNDASKIIRFFKTNSQKEALNILNEMYKCNIERKKYENKLYNKIVEYINNLGKEDIKYIYYETNDTNLGMMGSITSRLSVEYKIPVIIMSKVGNYYKASCRSIDNKNIFEVIESFSEYLVNYGGHNLAAGFLISASNLNLIRNDLKIKLGELNSVSDVKDEIFIDCNLKIDNLSKKNLSEINLLSPFGLSNDEPNFYDDNIKLSNITIFGLSNNHFKASIFKNGKEIQILGYNLTSKLNLKKSNKLYKIVYTPELVNKKVIRLKLKDIE